MAFQSFEVSSISTQSSSSSFDHGCEYPAVIVALTNASKMYQEQIKSGVLLLVLIKDNNDRFAFRTMFVNLEGYVLSPRATYTKLMQGLLRCSDADSDLKRKIIAAGLNDLKALIGKPCLARMSIKESNGKSWANIETLVGETARSKGIDPSEAVNLEPVDIRRLAGKFIRIQSVSDSIHIDGLKLIDNMKDVADGLSDVIRDNENMSVF